MQELSNGKVSTLRCAMRWCGVVSISRMRFGGRRRDVVGTLSRSGMVGVRDSFQGRRLNFLELVVCACLRADERGGKRGAGWAIVTSSQAFWK